MLWIKRLLWLVLTLALAVVVAAAVYVWRASPQLDGELRATGLRNTVTVQRDDADVTHIKATTRHDAWFALGYVHAQERGWQMEFNRRIVRGTLSEILGEATLPTDKLMRTLGILQAARRQLASMPAEAREALEAYSAGVQSFYDTRPQALSPEFLLLGVRPGADGNKAWEPEDSVGWSLMMALDLGGNWGNEFARLSAAQVLDTQRLWQLFPPYAGDALATGLDLAALYRQLGIYRPEGAGTEPKGAGGRPTQGRTGPAASELQAWADSFVADAGTAEGKGSNNWVVSGAHTTSGKPLLANDPHLGLSAPAIWYFARLQAPGVDVIGATLPGLPFVVLGRTRSAAWGFTNTGPDVQDLYLEQIHPSDPGQYRVPGPEGQTPTWAAFTTRTEVFRVKGKPDVSHTVRSTRHGPVISDAQPAHGQVLDLQRFVLALRWSALEEGNDTVLAMKRVNEAQSVPQLVEAFAGYHSPMQSVVMADTEGRIGFKAVGAVPQRRDDNDIRGVAPAPGWDPRYDWSGWLPYDQTPEQGLSPGDAPPWIASANQRITAPGYPHFIGQDWAAPYRYKRIAHWLDAAQHHDAESMRKLQFDQHSLAAQRLLKYVRNAETAHPLAEAARGLLRAFEGDMRADSAAALVFNVWVDELTRGLLIPRLGVDRFASMYGKRHFREAVEGILERDDAWWCAPLSCAGQTGAALTRTLDRLQALYGSTPSTWRWGDAHPAQSSHRPLGNVPMLAPLFDVSVPSGGDTFSVNVGQYWPNDPKLPFANRHAASLRAIYDLSDLERSQFIYQTGQSGLALSERYRDMRDEWASARYRPLRMEPPLIRHTLQLFP